MEMDILKLQKKEKMKEESYKEETAWFQSLEKMESLLREKNTS